MSKVGCILCIKRGEEAETIKLIVVPEGMKIKILAFYHRSMMGGHQGINRTVERILRTFWWKGLNADVKRYIAECAECFKAKTPAPKEEVMRSELIIPEPFHTVFIDHVQLNETTRGNKYILTMYCGSTGWIEAAAVASVTAQETAENNIQIYNMQIRSATSDQV